MATITDLHGHTFLHDRADDRDLANAITVRIDLETAVIVVGDAGDRRRDELVFDDVRVRRALTTVVEAMRRHAYRHRLVTPVPKPRRHGCELCDGKRTITNPYSGEVFRCPVCG